MDTATETETDNIGEPEVVEEAPEVVEVRRDEPDDGPKERTSGERPSRKERKSDFVRQAKEEAAERTRELQAERAERQRLANEVAEMRGYLAAQAQRQQQDPNATPEKRIEALEEEADSHLRAAAAAAQRGDDATNRRELRNYNAKLREANALFIEARQNPRLDQRFQELRGQIPDPQTAETRMTLAAEFPWLQNDDEARSAADAAINRLMRSGRPDGLATYREACSLVAKRMGLGGRSARPTDGQRARYNGMGAGESSGGGGDTVQIENNLANRRLAAASFRELAPEEAWKAWTKMIANSR
jgi:hypothetical protein